MPANPASLHSLYDQAIKAPGKPARLDLSDGLRIELIVAPDQEHRLLLARRLAHPSTLEWQIALSNLPHPPAHVEPQRFTYQDWFCLRASWRITLL